MLELGQTGFFAKTVTESDVCLFSGITGDFNQLHINEEEAKKTVFGSRIVHGMLTGSFISTVLGTKIPGPGTIYLEQNLKFLKPVYIGDTVTAKVVISEIINAEKGIYRLDTIIINSKNETVTDGYAIVKYIG